VACPEKDGEIQEDVVITVNGTQLSYGLPILYEGQELTKIPIYYSDISFSPGDSLSVAASVSGGKTPFFQDVVTVPSELSMTEPSETKFFENQEIDVSWNNTSDTMLYYLSFFDPIESVSKAYETTTLVTIAKIPKSYVEPGELMLEVHAFNGKNIDELFIDDDDDEDDILDKSYWIASTYDYKNLAIEANTESKDIDVNLSPLSEAERATVPLKLLKVDRVKIKGITFTRRIYDAQQITSPGQAQISVKLKRKHLAISAINVLDADQKQYFEWSHTRDHKSKNKTYNHSINLVPYSTVIIHTKSSDLLTLNYSY